MYKLKLFLRNNKLTRKLYYKLFLLKDRRKRVSLQKECINVTRDIYNAFEENHLEYAYDCGNLLGLVREQKFMEHDDDIDLMLLCEDENILVKFPKMLEPYGFHLIHYYVVEEKIVEYTFAYKKTGLTIDVCVNYRTNDSHMISYWMYQDSDKSYANENEMTVSMIKKTAVTQFEYVNYWGVDLRIPANAEEVLYYNYGEKWMIKDTGYSSKKAPGFVETDKIGKRVLIEENRK